MNKIAKHKEKKCIFAFQINEIALLLLFLSLKSEKFQYMQEKMINARWDAGLVVCMYGYFSEPQRWIMLNPLFCYPIESKKVVI